MSNFLRKIGINRKTLREVLLSELELEEDPNRLTTITIRLGTKRMLEKWIPKGLTYDEGIRRIIALLEKYADRKI